MIKRLKTTVMVAHPELQWLFDSPDTVVPAVETVGCCDIAMVVGLLAGALACVA